MKNLKPYYDKLTKIYESLEEIVSDLEEQRDAIDERAADRGRDMTAREQERYDAFDEKVDCIRDALSDLQATIDTIETCLV